MSALDHANNESDPYYFGAALSVPILRADVDGALRIFSSDYEIEGGAK